MARLSWVLSLVLLASACGSNNNSSHNDAMSSSAMSSEQASSDGASSSSAPAAASALEARGLLPGQLPSPPESLAELVP